MNCLKEKKETKRKAFLQVIFLIKSNYPLDCRFFQKMIPRQSSKKELQFKFMNETHTPS